MFSKEPSVSKNNAEGAILLQIIFQVFEGTGALDEFFQNILDRVVERLKGDAAPAAKSLLRKSLLQVFLSATIYNASATLKYLDMRQLTKEIVVELIQAKKQYKTDFERKCFIVGITGILKVSDPPASINDPHNYVKFIQEMLEMLDKVK